ncbi:MAG: hypothetical protein ABEJ23_01155 [Haloarculaceae archaeon]
MNWRRRLLVGVGVLTVAASLVAGRLPVGAATSALGGSYLLVAAIGAGMLVVVALALVARGIGGIDQTTPPDPEGVADVPTPGTGFDEFVDGRVSLRERFTGDRHEQVRTRLTDAAVTTLMRTEGLSRDGAAERVERGTWTDDRAASAFLAEGTGPGLAARLAAALRGQSTFQHGARRAAVAIARREGDA